MADYQNAQTANNNPTPYSPQPTPFSLWPSLAPFSKTLSLPGGELFYYDSDSNAADKPAIVLVHGLGDEADTWRHIFPLLINAGYRVIAPDLPGAGRSLWKGRISMRGHCNAVMRLITATGVASMENPATLVGSSLGSGIAEMVAVKRPELVKSLILLDGCFPFPYKLDRGMVLLSLPFVGKNWYRAFRSNHEGAWKSLYPYYGDLNAMSEADRTFLRERVIARVESANQERGYFATMRSMNTFIIFNSHAIARAIKKFSGPIAMIWGSKDKIFLPRRAELLRSLRPDIKDITFIDGAGHLPHQEKPDACFAEMMRFLQNSAS